MNLRQLPIDSIQMNTKIDLNVKLGLISTLDFKSVKIVNLQFKFF